MSKVHDDTWQKLENFGHFYGLNRNEAYEIRLPNF